MTGLAIAITLASAPAAGLAAAALGRWSMDAAARVAALLSGVGWVTALALGVVHVMAPGTTNAASGSLLPVTVDTLALMMLALVLGLSTVIQIFAVRYLRGDDRQGWFVVSANAVTAATTAVVCADSVLWFSLAWLAAGAALVALLATYPHLSQARAGVRRTATRLLIGDLALVLAVGTLMISARGDVALDNLRPTLERLPGGQGVAVALLLTIPALARSSQIPFQGWLPATLAAPTPVSALMHAGVVNAGAILIIRFSPAISESPLALAIIFGAGALTLSYASAIRLVKADVKGRLVFSTMAQMGFMMLACGLGAYAAAVFHLIAHGLFKSALFLGAGSGVSQEARQRAWPARHVPEWPEATGAIALGVTVPVVSILLARTLVKVELTAAGEALQLFVIFTAGVALGAMLWTRFSTSTAALGALAVAFLAVGYTAFVAVFENALALGTPPAAVVPWWLLAPAAALLVLQLPFRPRGRGRIAHRAFALAVSVGTPTTRPASRPKPSPKETVS